MLVVSLSGWNETEPNQVFCKFLSTASNYQGFPSLTIWRMLSSQKPIGRKGLCSNRKSKSGDLELNGNALCDWLGVKAFSVIPQHNAM